MGASEVFVVNREDILRCLREHMAEIRALGVGRLSLFGSVARGEATNASDLDVLVAFEGTATLDGYMDLRDLLERLTGRRVDLVTERALKPMLRTRVEQDLVRVA